MKTYFKEHILDIKEELERLNATILDLERKSGDDRDGSLINQNLSRRNILLKHLESLNLNLRKIQDDKVICFVCEINEIEKERLAIIPWTHKCKDCSQQEEVRH